MRKALVKGQAARLTGTTGGSRRSNYIAGLQSIDWPGVFMFILGVGLIILALQWGGTQYAWDSAATIAPFAVGGLLIIAFFMHEYLLGPGRFTARLLPNQVPMIPSALFRKKDTFLLMIINFSAGISLVSAFYFISYYWQLAEGYSSSKAGIQLLYYTPGLGVGVYVAMFLCNVRPAQTFFPLFVGSIVEGIGLAVLTYAVSVRHGTLVSVFLAISGAGTGLRFMPVVLHAAGIWSTRVPAMQSLLSFMLPLGETIGISMMGAVFSNKLNHSLSGIADYKGVLGILPVLILFQHPSRLPCRTPQLKQSCGLLLLSCRSSACPSSLRSSLAMSGLVFFQKAARTANQIKGPRKGTSCMACICLLFSRVVSIQKRRSWTSAQRMTRPGGRHRTRKAPWPLHSDCSCKA